MFLTNPNTRLRISSFLPPIPQAQPCTVKIKSSRVIFTSAKRVFWKLFGHQINFEMMQSRLHIRARKSIRRLKLVNYAISEVKMVLFQFSDTDFAEIRRRANGYFPPQVDLLRDSQPHMPSRASFLSRSRMHFSC